MEGLPEGDDLIAATGTGQVAEATGQLVEGFVGVRAPVAEEAAPGGTDEFDDAFGQEALQACVVEVGDVAESAGLPGQGFRQTRVRVAQAAHGNARAKVEVWLAGFVPDLRALASFQAEREAAVRRQDVLVKQLGSGNGSGGIFLHGGPTKTGSMQPNPGGRNAVLRYFPPVTV